MRNAMPVRWIEQKEARQVIASALFERAPKAPWSTTATAGEAASQWLPRLGSWLAARHPMRPVDRPRTRDDDGYSCDS